jgi:putative addiction module component (TIGR02574 family)
MSPKAQIVRTEALALSASERASLAHDLILSLDEPAALDLNEEQEQEIGRRVLSVREGTAHGRPAADVFRKIKARLGK